MYNNPYINNYNSQMNLDRINNQINELEKMKAQMQQPLQTPSINQTFQLASPQNGLRYANTIDDVVKENVIFETPFFSKDMSIVWIKNGKGEIKTYNLEEIVQKDNKDIMIESLQMQIEQLRKEVKQNAKSAYSDVDESDENTKSTSVQPNRTTKKK